MDDPQAPGAPGQPIFAELPSALVHEVLEASTRLGTALVASLQELRARRPALRQALQAAGLLGHDRQFPWLPPPTTCGIDGSYAIERLLGSDLVACAAVAVEGLTPPSEVRHWPEPHHRALVQVLPHAAETGTLARALMLAFELELAAEAPHGVVFLDGSLATPLIHLNQAAHALVRAPDHPLGPELRRRVPAFLRRYRAILEGGRTDRAWVAVPKYTTRREVGQLAGWRASHDDRAVLSTVLQAGEFTRPVRLQRPEEPWHLDVAPLGPPPGDPRGDPGAAAPDGDLSALARDLVRRIEEIRVVYYRPHPWLPALRLEMAPATAENPALLATVLQAVHHQCAAPGVLEPHPLYMADRWVRNLAQALPAFRQVATQAVAERYAGPLEEVFFHLHGYRSESGRGGP